MRQGWMGTNRRLGSAALLLAALGLTACSDDPRIPDGQHFPGVVLIDDMEDGTQYILSDDGLVGLWYTYNDASPSGTQEPAQGFPMYRTRRPDGSPDVSSQVAARECGAAPNAPYFEGEENCTFVARTWGTGQRGWGAGMGLDVNGEGGTKNPIDASAYGGIGFFVRANPDPMTGMPLVRGSSLRVNVQEARTTPESALAADRRRITRCESYTPEGTPTGRCNDHFGVGITVTTDWRWVQIPFNCMAGQNFGYPGAPAGSVPADQLKLRRDAIVGIQFQVTGADPADDGMAENPVLPFDFAIDNLAFLTTDVVNDTSPCSF